MITNHSTRQGVKTLGACYPLLNTYNTKLTKALKLLSSDFYYLTKSLLCSSQSMRWSRWCLHCSQHRCLWRTPCISL